MLTGDDVNDVVAVEVPGLAQERLVFVVVVVRVVDEVRLVATIRVPGHGIGDGPAGERPGRFLDVILGVVGVAVHSDAHGEQFQQLAAPVLVDRALVAHAVVQVEHHGRVAGQALEQDIEAAHAQIAEHVQLQLDLPTVLALGVARAEDPVPEKGHLLLQRALGVDHSVGKIRLINFQGVHLFPVDEVPLQDVHFQVGLGNGVEQFLDGGFITFGGALFQLGVSGAETGPTHQVRHLGNFLVGGHSLYLLGCCGGYSLHRND